MKRSVRAGIVLIAVLLLLITTVVCMKRESDKIIREELWLDSGHGDWIRAEAMVPGNYKSDSLPLITIGHGFHGNMDSAGGGYLSEALSKAGFAVIRMDYAHYEKKDVKTVVNSYTVETMIEDQLTCIKYMKECYNVNTDRIGLYGRSLGGRVAMTMANKSSGGYSYKAMALVAPAGTADALSYYMGGDEKWREMKMIADKKGSITHQQVLLTPEFFSSVDEYTPSEDIGAFEGAVLVIYNTEDYVVLPETSKKCAAAYKKSQLVEVTSEKSPHGYEMGFKKSKLKDELIGRITIFFEKELK